MADRVSADTDRLDAFAAVARDDRTTMAETLVELEAGRAGLANLPLPFFVDATPLVRYGELTEAMAGTGGYAADVSLALQTFGVDLGDGRYSAAGSVIGRELDRSNAERLDGFEQQLVDQGVSEEEAAKIAAEVDAALEADPSLSFGDAVLAGIAAYEGVTVDELLQRRRAYDLYPAEVGAVIDENFDLIAGQTGDPDSITTGDLLLTIENEDLPQEVRDAAYRLAADSVLFNNMDVAHQTDLSDEPLTNGFAWDDADGVIGRDDAAEFPAKDHQARILLGWHPLIETAADGYDLSRGDSHASADDVIAFAEDDDIPIYIRLAVFDVYAERHGLDLERRIELEQELALDAGGLAVGGRTVLDAGVSLDGRGSGRPAPVLPGVSGGSRSGARGPAGSGGGGTLAAVYVELLTISISAGWNAGHRARIARDGEPTFVYTDPLTGAETELDPIVLVGLTPAEAKAYVAHFTAHGTPPSIIGDTIEPHPYLDADGQWRMSDTGEPTWIEPPAVLQGETASRDGETVTPDLEPELATDGAGARSGGRGKRPTGLVGLQFEEWLRESFGGSGSFKQEGREFDGAFQVGRWYEAKSGRYWQDHVLPGPGFEKFKSDMGSRLRIAKDHGATYELHSNVPIPHYVKNWLDAKGIGWTEHL